MVLLPARWLSLRGTPAVGPHLSLPALTAPQGQSWEQDGVVTMNALSAALCWSMGALGRAVGGQADGKAVILEASPGELGQECLAWRHWVSGGTWDLHPLHGTLPL